MSNEFPKVTVNDLASAISTEHYFTAAEGARAAETPDRPGPGSGSPLDQPLPRSAVLPDRI